MTSMPFFLRMGANPFRPMRDGLNVPAAGERFSRGRRRSDEATVSRVDAARAARLQMILGTRTTRDGDVESSSSPVGGGGVFKTQRCDVPYGSAGYSASTSDGKSRGDKLRRLRPGGACEGRAGKRRPRRRVRPAPDRTSQWSRGPKCRRELPRPCHRKQTGCRRGPG